MNKLAKAIVNVILTELKDRRGVGQQLMLLESEDEYTYLEMYETLVQHTEKLLGGLIL